MARKRQTIREELQAEEDYHEDGYTLKTDEEIILIIRDRITSIV